LIRGFFHLTINVYKHYKPMFINPPLKIPFENLGFYVIMVSMKYLLYYRDGFIKKFPLSKPAITIGRSSENDLIIDEDYVSRRHMRIDVKDTCIAIYDLNSTNGIYVEGTRVKQAVIQIGESFFVKGTSFILRDGSLEEFKLAEELIPVFDKIQSENEKKIDTTETRYVKNVFTELLKHILAVGLKKSDFHDFILEVSAYLNSIRDFGSIFLVSRENDNINVILSIKREKKVLEQLKGIMEQDKNIFKEDQHWLPIPGSKNNYFCSYTLNIKGCEAALIYIPLNLKKDENEKVEQFLYSFAKEITLLSQIMQEEKKSPKLGIECGKPFTFDEIVASDSHMKNLIKQAKKIAQSNIFVLIQGESGTGKELFARLLHNHSPRAGGQYVALNCAAIPENLLESELFGHEKGAFTGAYSQKKGKLEMASGGTLVLDEIADMPLGLQIKLLRVLQEQEFYRLGGNIPIKVNLRIIALTNCNLKQLIKDEKFREDLYYRLAHHIITIPSLRERKEDISALTTFFTRKYCKINNKTVRGYSMKVFEILQNYNWPGNVRQVENEINRLINLVDDGGTIDYDLLSDELKFSEVDFEDTCRLPPYMADARSEREYIMKLLEKNQWNKSKTARDLNMTYQGLHKKMKRLSIARSRPK
jgi:transcriptional regulator with PAS, ATPase and Fis domain